MARRKSESSVPEKRVKKSAGHTKTEEIDFSDIAELSDEQLKAMRPVGRPPIGDKARQMIAIRIDHETLEALRTLARKQKKGYQTLINEILEEYLNNIAA